MARLWQPDESTPSPLGRNFWNLQRPVCDQSAGSMRKLLLSACHEGQYTCDDGTCITHDLRCDFKYDCRDQSDESYCRLVRLPQDYKVGEKERNGDKGDQRGKQRLARENYIKLQRKPGTQALESKLGGLS